MDVYKKNETGGVDAWKNTSARMNDSPIQWRGERFERAAVGRYLIVLVDYPLYSGDQMYPACTYKIA